MDVLVKDGQTLADISIQEYGALEAVVRLAIDNGMCISDVPATGTPMRLHEATYNRVMQQYCKVNAIAPATLQDNTTGKKGIFNQMFNRIYQ